MYKALNTLLVGSTVMLSAGCVTQHSVKVSSQNNQGYHSNIPLYFSQADRSKIKGYYLYNYPNMRRMPHGQRKKHERKHKQRHALPRNVHYARLPHDLDRRLPRLPAGYSRVRIGEEIAIMNLRTRIIYDVMWFNH